MSRHMTWRLGALLVLGLLAAYMVSPTLIYFFQPAEVRNDDEAFDQVVPRGLPRSHVKLGLDIQGGVQLVLGIDSESAIDNHLAKIAVEIKRWSDDGGFGKQDEPAVVSAYNVKNAQRLALVVNVQEEVWNDFFEALKDEFSGLVVVSRDENTVELAYNEETIQRIRESSLEQAERVVRSRVDKWGVSEPLIHRRQNGSILVQLPGFSNPEKAKELLGRTAQLQFKIVDDNFSGWDEITSAQVPEGIVMEERGSGVHQAFSGEDRAQLAEFLSPYVPQDRVLLFEREQLAGTKNRWTTLVVRAATEMTGNDIIDASVVMGGEMTPQPQVSLKFSALGGRRFADVTGRNVGQRMAIVLDDVVESAPVIQSKISGGEASITLNAGPYQEVYDEANELALILRSGSVPATVSILEERQVGSTLGPELARKGIQGILVGLASVLFFMLLYYRRPGLFACIVLLLNGLLLLAGMALFEFALTLPGIAGFILTLGMAVDANVLINERIRQELVNARNAKKSIDQAFKKVFWTIVDANITTLIACMILLETNSSGPIRGFAITLMMGLIISLFTSLYVTRVLFAWVVSRKKDAALRVWFGHKERKPWNVPFLRVAKPASGVIMAACILIVALFSTRGLNWGVDFAGGTEMVLGFSDPISATELRSVAEESSLSNVTIQAMGTDNQQFLVRYENTENVGEGSSEMMEVTSSAQFFKFKEAFSQRFAAQNPSIEQIDFVGPQVGQELRTQGLLSVIYAIIGILLYIALRFDIRFGSGAIVKMCVDVLLVLGFYLLFHRTFDLTSVAAFLTVLGYSVNDTIVIYDRIRENILAFGKKPLFEIIHMSLNETLTRTLNTSITTLMALLGILIFSSGQLWTFAMAIAVGVVAATLSSTLIASSFLLAYEHVKRKKISQKQEGSRGGVKSVPSS